jgi:RNA polymerase sigma factor (sigma-70 family)
MVQTCPAEPEDPFDLGECLAVVRRVEPRAAEALVRHCQPMVARLVGAHRPRSVHPEDLVQEVFLALFLRLDRYQARDGIPFEHWLARVTVNVCRDALRAERRRPVSVSLPVETAAWIASLLIDPAPPVDDALAARAAVEALLAELPAEDRLLLTLLSLEERSLEEVSALTGRSRTVLKVRAFRARRRLQDAARRLLALPGVRSDE